MNHLDDSMLDPDELDELAESMEGQFITSMDGHLDDIMERFQSGVTAYGQTLPWGKTHDAFRFRPSEVTLWAGINGHGKSQMLSHVSAHISKSQSVLIASMEMPISATGHRMMRQMLGTSNPTKKAVAHALNWTKDKVWIYDQLDTVKKERILAMVVHAFKNLKVGHVIIDSLVKCGINPDDFNSQKDFVDRLCWIAKAHKGHIHLVHHVRKSEKETNRPDKFDMKGAGEIGDLADNIMIVFRRKDKEAAVAAVDQGGTLDEKWAKCGDTELIVAKQRHGEWEGKINLWFDKSSQQYRQYPGANLEYFDFGSESGKIPGSGKDGGSGAGDLSECEDHMVQGDGEGDGVYTRELSDYIQDKYGISQGGGMVE